MEITVIDKSSYLKGLLIIAKQDNQLAQTEKEMIRGIAVKLGFARDFYEETIRNLLSNKYINNDAIKFSDRKVAESFIKDGLMLAFSDSKVSDVELDWLYSTALENGIESSWFEEKRREIETAGSASRSFALYSII